MKNRFVILCGLDTLALESTLMGVDGLICAFPKETVAINNLVNAGKIQGAVEIYRWFLPLLELDINPKLVQNIKLAEVYTKIGTENVRAPRLPLFGEERKHVFRVVEESLKTRLILPNYKNL